jgi:hypothetical protein
MSMSAKQWQTLKVRFCERVGQEVSLDAEVVYPSDQLPDLSPRVFAHRCSLGYECAVNNQGVCVWSGANPDYDPFKEDAKE